MRSSPRAVTIAKALGITAVVAASAFAIALLWLGRAMPSRQPSTPSAADQGVRVSGHRLVYQAHGDGSPVLILLHGFGGTGEGHWGKVADRLRCGSALTVDLLGFGASARPDVSYTLAMHARYVVGLMDALDIEHAVLGGLSMGGSIAATVAARAESRVHALGLFAPSGLPGSLEYDGLRGATYQPGRLNRMGRLVARTPLFHWLFPHSLARQALGVTSSYGPRFRDALSRITQPTLLAWSRGDERVPFSHWKQYRDRIPTLRFREAPAKAGHAISINAPQWTADALCELVDGLPDTAEHAMSSDEAAGAGASP